MRNYRLRFCAILIVLFFISIFSQCAFAQTPVTKLGRGMANVASCWCEMPHQMMNTYKSDGALAAWSVGILKGVCMTVLRGLVGVYEVCTFPAPLPKEYKPILRYPEFFFKEPDF